MPSIGIYLYELFNFYGVDNILRIGSAGGLAPECKAQEILLLVCLPALILIIHHSTECLNHCAYRRLGLLSKAVAGAEKLGYPVRVGNILASDVFLLPEQLASKWAT